MEKHFRHNSLFVGPADRAAIADGSADSVSVHLSEIPALFRDRIIPLDVAFLHLSPPDEHGFMSLGVECAASKAAVESAKVVVAQVNDKMPRTLGDVFVHVSHVDKIVECSEELETLPHGSGYSDVEMKIGSHIAGLIEDGSTLQLGIGGIPDAVLSNLEGKNNLGVHTEMVSDGVVKAIEKGIITNQKKTLHPGKVIATFVLGSKELYEYVHNNPYFEIHPCDYTNNPFIISRNENMVAINSAIEVDVTGQVCADSIGHDDLQRLWRPGRLYPRRLRFQRRETDHRSSVDGEERDGVAHRRTIIAGSRSRDVARRRSLCCHRIRRRIAARQKYAAEGRCVDRHRASSISRRAS